MNKTKNKKHGFRFEGGKKPRQAIDIIEWKKKRDDNNCTVIKKKKKKKKQ